MSFLNMIPIVGTSTFGAPVMMTMTTDGSAMGDSVQTLNSNVTDSSWDQTTVECIQSTPNGILATGYSTTKDSQTSNVAWKYSGGWTAGFVDFSSIREDSGVSYYGSNFLVADGGNQKVRMSPFAFPSGSVVGNVNSSVFVAPNANSNNFQLDNVSSTGSKVVATSIEVKLVNTPVGSVVENGEWESYAGEPRNYDTGHVLTTYTFPGYAGSNAQVQRTVAVADETDPYDPPTLWDTENDENEGFYGLTNCPSFSFQWMQ